MVEQVIKKWYGMDVLEQEKMKVGAGSDTYVVTTGEGKFILKFPSASEMNNPELEPKLCEYLFEQGIPVSEFIKNKDGEYICNEEERSFHLQKFIDGTNYGWHQAPDWYMKESAKTLGKIHDALESYEKLPEGIGKAFFSFMTPEFALNSYENTLKVAKEKKNTEIEKDVEYRIGLMKRFPDFEIDVDKLTCKNTHGDYFISQVLCGKEHINAIIDWTTACVHPVIWEIVRSFLYAEPSCKEGNVEIDKLITYIQCYLEYTSLNTYDLEMLLKVYYYQISVCDYYGQYYSSDADNRQIYLEQAVFSTKLMKWFEENLEEAQNKLNKVFGK